MHLLYDLLGLFTAHVLYPYAEKKYSRIIIPKLAVLRLEASLPFAERKRLAQERLVQALDHAGRTVPYYRDLFAAHHFSPDSVRQDVRHLDKLPYLTKEIVREQGARLLSETRSGPLHERKTGGSTGPATLIFYDQEGLDWTAAQNILMLEWAGKRRYNREAHLSSRFLQPLPPNAVQIEARKCFLLNRHNIYTSGLNPAAQKQLYADLRTAHARFVQGHPSSMAALAHYLLEQKGRIPRIFDVFVSTGEMLMESQRALIEKVLRCRVSNRYGACEFGVMAQERAGESRGELLVSDSMVWPEVAEPGPDGEGELVFTAIRNRAMPLIRYRMGDLGRLSERADGWWLSSLTGRIHDAVVIDGVAYPTHYVQDILDRCGPITDFQITVRDDVAQELRIVCAPEDWTGVAAAVSKNFPTIPLRRITMVELVLVGRREKFKYTVELR